MSEKKNPLNIGKKERWKLFYSRHQQTQEKRG